MIRDRNIVCVASSWFDHPTSKHHVMRILSEHNDVLWVGYHASRRPKLGVGDGRVVLRRLRQAWSGWQRVAPSLQVLSPLLIPIPGSRPARFLNMRRLAGLIRRALRRLPKRPTQLWLFTPDVPELIDLIPAERVVYYCVDEFSAFAGFDQALVDRLERRTLDRSDVVITSSSPLQEKRAAQHAYTHLVPHGVDFDHFANVSTAARGAIPSDIENIARPVFGYFGLISDYVDLELIAAAARVRPDWSFVFLGDVRRSTDPLAGLRNVRLLGPKPYERLPAYSSRFDVGLIPFRLNRLTRSVNPIKLREYLAAGLPVVSSPMPEVKRYAPAVRTAETLDEFLPACEAMLDLSRRTPGSERQALVRTESWRARVDQLSRIVTNVLEVSGRSPTKSCSLSTTTRRGGLSARLANRNNDLEGRSRSSGDDSAATIGEARTGMPE